LCSSRQHRRRYDDRAVRGAAQRSAASLGTTVGGWLLVTAAVLSFGQGIIHPYYTVVPITPSC
ncbi:MAG: hypothetical protein JWM45_4205, partial [Pseudonocardiales bacterium]|nr:hypothetical protein [Pseudonocardiales bacterium]